MQLRLLDKGEVLNITEENADQEHPVVYNATLHKLVSDTVFFVKDEALHRSFRPDTLLRINFFRNPNKYTLTAKTKGIAKDKNLYLTKLEQLTRIEITNSRKHHREGLLLLVKLYRMEVGEISSGNWSKGEDEAVFVSQTLDISTGGLCLGSNEILDSPYEPYFLAEFTLNQKEQFLLPAKLVRKGNCPHTSLYKYDYGFLFLLDEFPKEEERLATTLLGMKLDAVFKK